MLDALPAMRCVRGIELLAKKEVMRGTEECVMCHVREGMRELREAFREKQDALWADWLENNMRLWSLCRA